MKRRRDVVVAVIGIVVGIGLATVAPRWAERGPVVDELARLAESPPATSFPDQPEAVLPKAEPDSPQAAVEGFLKAEIEGDLARSYRFLSATDRADLATPADWTAVHADTLAPIVSFELTGAEETGSEASIWSVVHFQAGIDPVLGLTPGIAEVEWSLVDEDGAWLISLGESRITPRYPSDQEAAGAAESWAVARQQCPIDSEEMPDLVGPLGLEDDLCGRNEPVRVSGVSLLEDPVEAAPFVDAYGPEVVDWARVVAILAPVEMTAVLAPIGEEWVVIGVLGGD